MNIVSQVRAVPQGLDGQLEGLVYALDVDGLHAGVLSLLLAAAHGHTSPRCFLHEAQINMAHGGTVNSQIFE